MEENTKVKSEAKVEVKTKGKVKRIAMATLTTSIVIILAVAVIYFGLLILQSNQAKNKVDTIFSVLKSGTTSEKDEYIQYNNILSKLKNLGGIPVENEDEYGMDMFFNNLEYRIISAEADFNTAKVLVEVTNKDVGQVFSNYVLKAVQLAFQSAFSTNYSNQELNEQLTEYFQEQMNSESIGKVTNSITIEFKKENGQWNMTTDKNALADVVLPGLVQKIDGLEESLNGIVDEVIENETSGGDSTGEEENNTTENEVDNTTESL